MRTGWDTKRSPGIIHVLQGGVLICVSCGFGAWIVWLVDLLFCLAKYVSPHSSSYSTPTHPTHPQTHSCPAHILLKGPSITPMPPRPAPAPPPAAAARKGAIEKLGEFFTLVTLGTLLLGCLYLKVYGFAFPGRSHGSNSSSDGGCRHALFSFVGGAGGNRAAGEDELREIMVLAKRAQQRGEIAQYGGLKGWLEHYMKSKKTALAGTTPISSNIAQPEASSPSAQEAVQGSRGSFRSLFLTALFASMLAAAVLHHLNNHNNAVTPP